MSAITKPRTSIFAAIGSLFSSGIDIENEETVKLDQELLDVLSSLASKEANVEQAINANGSNNSKKGGIRKKYVTPEIKSIKEMTSENLEKMIETLRDKEIDDK